MGRVYVFMAVWYNQYNLGTIRLYTYTIGSRPSPVFTNLNCFFRRIWHETWAPSVAWDPCSVSWTGKRPSNVPSPGQYGTPTCKLFNLCPLPNADIEWRVECVYMSWTWCIEWGVMYGNHLHTEHCLHTTSCGLVVSIIAHAQGYAAPPTPMQEPINMSLLKPSSDPKLPRSYWKTGSPSTEPVLVQQGLQQWPLSLFIEYWQVSVVKITLFSLCLRVKRVNVIILLLNAKFYMNVALLSAQLSSVR